MIHNIPQPAFEQFVSEYLAHDKNVDVRKGVSFVSLEQVRLDATHLSLIAQLTDVRLATTSRRRWRSEPPAINFKYAQGTLLRVMEQRAWSAASSISRARAKTPTKQ